MRTLLLTANTTLLLAVGAAAQQTAATPGAMVPRLVRIANTYRPGSGPASPVESVTLSIYKEERGGTTLWSETQNVAVDTEGRYTVLMGSTLPDGVPAVLFSTGEPRWLGVQFNRPGEGEQPRVQLVSVPYALKAADAETLGGMPASAYLLSPGAAAAVGSPGEAKSAGTQLAPSIKGATPRVNSGMPNCIGEFMNTTDLGCSNIWQNGINIGINTMNPTVAFDLGAGSFRVANYSAPSSGVGLELAYIPVNNSGYMFAYDRGALVAKDLNIGGSGAAITVKAAGNVGVGVANPASKLDVAGDINYTGVVRLNKAPVLQIVGAAGTTALGEEASASGSNNTALGEAALSNNMSGNSNTAVGRDSMRNSSGGMENTAVGIIALFANTGDQNTAVGAGALQVNTGTQNVAVGYQALNANTSGSTNNAIGASAMIGMTTGSSNQAMGLSALAAATDGTGNVAIGEQALQKGNPSYSVAVGYRALNQGSNGNDVAVGPYAMSFGSFGNNTAIGSGALSTGLGTFNIGVGVSAGNSIANFNSGNNIMIGNLGVSGDNDVTRIGCAGATCPTGATGQTSVYLYGIAAAAAGNVANVYVNTTTGQLFYTGSSRRYKEDIHDMGAASAALMRLRPVSFRYKKPAEDGSKPLEYGLIAEEVAEVYPELVAHSADGQIETVKYQAIPVMLLNEVQRQERTIQEERNQLDEQQRTIDQQAREIEALKAKLAALSSLEARLAALENVTAAQR